MRFKYEFGKESTMIDVKVHFKNIIYYWKKLNIINDKSIDFHIFMQYNFLKQRKATFVNQNL